MIYSYISNIPAIVQEELGKARYRGLSPEQAHEKWVKPARENQRLQEEKNLRGGHTPCNNTNNTNKKKKTQKKKTQKKNTKKRISLKKRTQKKNTKKRIYLKKRSK